MRVKEETIQSILTVAGCVFMLVFCLTPFIYMTITSINSSPEFLSEYTDLDFTIKNYHDILADKYLHFLDYLRNSIIVSGVSALFAVIIGGIAAYAITRLPFPGKALILFSVLAVSMFPQISLISYLFKFMSALGLINTYSALIFPYIAWILPLSLWILVNYFSLIPVELDKAALIDGCSRLQILRKVIFPVAAPGLLSTALLAFIFAFNEFVFAIMLTTDYHARTIPVGIALFQGLHGEIPWGTIMAAATITTVPVVILTLIFQRRIIEGLTRGALKG